MKYLIAPVLVCLLSCSEEKEKPQNTHPVWSPDGSAIAYINNEEGTLQANPIDFEIFTVNANGGNVMQHTFNDVFEADLAWSQDGNLLAFKSYQDGNDEVYLLDLRNGNQVNISNHTARDSSPQFVNGQLVYTSQRDHEAGELYAYNFANDSITRVTFNDYDESGAVWTADGEYMVFSSNQDGDDDLYLAKSNGDSLIQLTNNPLNDWYPQLSPDENSVMFTYGDWETDQWELRLLDLATLEQTTILSGNDSGNASWHPSGSSIAYGSSKLGDGHIFIYDLITREEVRLTK